MRLFSMLNCILRQQFQDNHETGEHMQKKYDVIVDPESGQRYYIDPGTGEAI